MKRGMFVLFVIALLAAGVAAYGVSAVTTTVQLYGLVNDFSSPIIPFNPHLLDDSGNPDPTGCFGQWMDTGLLGGDTLDYFDPVNQISSSFPSNPQDHPILMGDGYGAWVVGTQNVVERSLTYQGVDISDTDAWISLPGQPDGSGGVHHIGIPYPVGTQIWWPDIIITDGVEAYTLMQLILENGNYDWGTFEFSSVDAPTQTSIGIPSGGEYVEGGRGYWLYTTKSNLAMILPSPS